MLRFLTAGESHGRALVVVVEGVPAGLEVAADDITGELARRRLGYGRGPRMRFEQDDLTLVGGVRHGRTLGSPIAIEIANTEWERNPDKWGKELSPHAADGPTTAPLTQPRPGHADLAGMQKYGFTDARDVLERASARETAARVACGALAKQLLAAFDAEIRSHVIQLGGVPDTPLTVDWDAINAIPDDAPLRCADVESQQRMVELIDETKRAGDTLGGIFEVVAHGLVPGLGSHTSWDSKLDGRLAQAVMSIPAVKAVALGAGVEATGLPGSQVHDEIFYDNQLQEFVRHTNRAGGLEGGVTNGAELRVRGFLKPISTLRRPLRSVDIDTKEEEAAAFERSDVTAVPAAGVIGEGMIALVLADAMVEKFGGDSLGEMRRNFDGYWRQLHEY